MIIGNTTIWWNKVPVVVGILVAIAVIIVAGSKAHMDGPTIATIVVPLAGALAQLLPAVAPTRTDVPAAAVNAVVAEAVKLAVSIAAPPPDAPIIVNAPKPPPLPTIAPPPEVKS